MPMRDGGKREQASRNAAKRPDEGPPPPARVPSAVIGLGNISASDDDMARRPVQGPW